MKQMNSKAMGLPTWRGEQGMKAMVQHTPVVSLGACNMHRGASQKRPQSPRKITTATNSPEPVHFTR